MAVIWCTHCDIPLTADEVGTGNCPHCGKAISASSSGGLRKPIRGEIPVSATTGDAGHKRSLPSKPIIDRIGWLVGAHTSDDQPLPWNTGNRIVMGLLGGVLTLIFGGMLVYAAFCFVESYQSMTWPSVQGKVKYVGTSEEVKHHRRRGRHLFTTFHYFAAVVYEYRVDGQLYTDTRIHFGPTTNFAALNLALADRYQKNQQVTVYYDPTNPKNAVLLRKVFLGGYVMGSVGLFLGFCGLRVLLVSVLTPLPSMNSRWLPWSRRFTWPDLPATVLGAIGLLLWLPMCYGL